MTYNLLLVDDEHHAIEGVRSDLDLAKLRIDGLFTAFNIRQAKEVMERERIDILLCDIEMPQGSGLELLTWVKERQLPTATIFLTSHADFKYAKEAIKLGSIEYLLKPVFQSELEEAIRNAQDVIERNSEHDRYSQSHQMWLQHHSMVIERFWIDLINHSIPSNRAAIAEQVERHHIPITERSVFLPVLISVQMWKKELKHRDEKVLEYALKNSAEEMILKKGNNGIAFTVDRSVLLIVLVADREATWNEEEIQESCGRYIESCNKYFYCDLSCYFGRVVEAHEMAAMVAELRAEDHNNVAYVNRVFPYRIKKGARHLQQLPALGAIVLLLKSGTRQSVIDEVDDYLSNLMHHQVIDAQILHRFQQDFIQALYSFLNTKGIMANQLFGDEESRRMSEAAGRSVTDMRRWIQHTIQRAMNQVEAFTETDSIIQSIRQFIAINMDQDLSREMIAEHVYMNADYMSRIFKRETGYSISDYIILERINQAKALLAQTQIPVSNIATSVGYNNFSHFAKIFKKYVGIGPTEYRSRHA